MSVSEVVDLFGPATFRWWLAGGHALEAHLERSWRLHDDIDIGITRSDARRLRRFLDGWDIHVASDGVLTRWDRQSLDDPSAGAGNNLWCRPSADAPWRLDVLIGGNAKRVADAYGSGRNMVERALSLALAVGCYKIAKTPGDAAARARIRSLLIP